MDDGAADHGGGFLRGEVHMLDPVYAPMGSGMSGGVHS